MKSKLSKTLFALLLTLATLWAGRASAVVPTKPSDAIILNTYGSGYYTNYEAIYKASQDFDQLAAQTQQEVGKGTAADIGLINRNIESMGKLNQRILTSNGALFPGTNSFFDINNSSKSQKDADQIEKEKNQTANANNLTIAQLKAASAHLPGSGVSPERQAELDQLVANEAANQAHATGKLSSETIDKDTCNGFRDFTVNGCLKAGAAWIGAILVWLFSRITWFANELFNQAINISVRTFSNYAGGAVQTSWGVLRDLVNMGFIFVLLYIAFGTILGLQGIDWKKLVPKLIIVALLVNFSMFFTRVIIDVSNVTANQFYLSAAQGTTSPIKSPDGETTFTGAPDITTALFKNIKVFSTNWLTAKSVGQDTSLSVEQVAAGAKLDWKDILVGTFGAVVLALVASFVLLTGAVLFIIRTIRLLFLIILSPFAFFFIILPKTEGYWKKWLSTLMNDATFAPAFLIMIYVVTQIADQMHASDNGSVIFFMLIIGLLLGAIIVAKALGAAGAAGAMKLAGATNAAIVGTGFGVTKLGGRYVGKGLQMADKGLGGKLYSDRWGITNKLLKGVSKTKEYAGTALKKAGEISPTLANAQKQLTGAIKNPLKTGSELLAQATKDYGVSGVLGRTKDEEREATKRAKEDKEAARDRELMGYATELEREGLSNERAAEILGKMKSKEIAKQKNKVLKKAAVIYNLNKNDIESMNREGVDREVMQEIYSKILADPNHPAFDYVQSAPFRVMRRGAQPATTPPNPNPAPPTTPNPPPPNPPINPPPPPTQNTRAGFMPTSPPINAPNFLITPDMKRELHDLGYTEQQVNSMTREEARSFIKYQQRP